MGDKDREAHHDPIDRAVRIRLDDRILNAIVLVHLTQLKRNAQRHTLLARKLGIGSARCSARSSEYANEFRRPTTWQSGRGRGLDSSSEVRLHFGEEGLRDGVCFEEDAFGRWRGSWVCHRYRRRSLQTKISKFQRF